MDGRVARRALKIRIAVVMSNQIDRIRCVILKEKKMSVTIFAKLKVKEGSQAAFEAAAKDMCAAVKANEPGAIHYVLHKVPKDPTSYWFYEKYTDQAAVDSHGKTDHMKAFGGKIGGCLDGRPEVIYA